MNIVAGALAGVGPGAGWRLGADEAAANHCVAHTLRAKHNLAHREDVDTMVAHTLRADGFDASEDGTGRGTPLVPVTAFHGSQDPDVSGDVTHPVGRNQGQETCAMVGTAVRRLMPVEYERLQGFPDNYTAITWRGKPAADGPRYKALGNSWAVNCARWIGRRIEAVESIKPHNARLSGPQRPAQEMEHGTE